MDAFDRPVHMACAYTHGSAALPRIPRSGYNVPPSMCSTARSVVKFCKFSHEICLDLTAGLDLNLNSF